MLLTACTMLGLVTVADSTLLAGKVMDPAGRPVVGAIVVGSPIGSSLRYGTTTEQDGRFHLRVAPAGRFRLAVVERGVERVVDTVAAGSRLELRTPARDTAALVRTSAEWLDLLPDGPAKRWFILDCTGCHQFNETRAFRTGRVRTAEEWAADATRMIASFGPGSGFPIIAAHEEPGRLGTWINRYVAAANGVPRLSPLPWSTGDRYQITEYDLPGPDLPHDIAVDSTGRVIVTGMFSHRLLELDRVTGRVSTIPIPVDRANPRAIEIDARGRWWVLLGQAEAVARFDPASGQWAQANVAMYGHSLGLDQFGNAWTNFHFAMDSIRLARVSERGGRLVTEEFRGPPAPGGARGPSPIPYELRVAPNGRVWVSTLHGGQLIAFDPSTGRFETVSLPEADAGPRRFDIDRRGVLWVPGYSASSLFRYDPATGRWDTYRLPGTSELPYVARVHPRTGDVWIGTAAGDVVYRFDPVRATFARYPVLTRGATMRHLVIDPRSGDIWVAFGASPAIHPTRVARIRIDRRETAVPEPVGPFRGATGGFIALSVPDLDASMRWYRDTLGLKLVMTIPRMGKIVGGAALEGDGIMIELLQRDDARPGPVPSELVHGIAKAGILVADFEGTVTALRARGVTFAGGPYPARPGQRPNVMFKDNAGNMLQILGPVAGAR